MRKANGLVYLKLYPINSLYVFFGGTQLENTWKVVVISSKLLKILRQEEVFYDQSKYIYP